MGQRFFRGDFPVFSAVTYLSLAQRFWRISVVCSPPVSTASEIVVNRPVTPRAVLLAFLLAVCAFRTGGQTPPPQDSYASQKPLAPLSATDPVVRTGLFTIDVVVTDPSGNPFSDLAPLDFTLLDNGRPAKIRTLNKARAPSEPKPELIFVLDAVNLTPQQRAQAESAISRFLLQNNGHLEFPSLLYRFTRDGRDSSDPGTGTEEISVRCVERRSSGHQASRLTGRQGAA